jgi:hypothetical protein
MLSLMPTHVHITTHRPLDILATAGNQSFADLNGFRVTVVAFYPISVSLASVYFTAKSACPSLSPFLPGAAGLNAGHRGALERRSLQMSATTEPM